MKPGKGRRKFPRELSKNKPKLPILKIHGPNPASYYFGEEEFSKKYNLNPNLYPKRDSVTFYVECRKAADEVWKTMTAEQRAPYEKFYQEKMDAFMKYHKEEYSKELDEYQKSLGEYIKSREEAAAAQGLTYKYECHEPYTDEEIDDDDEEDSEEDESEDDESEEDEEIPVKFQ